MSDKTENVILRLRPVSGKAVDLPAALAAATTAAAEQEQAVVRARVGRDDALLDAAPSALRQAEQVLAAAREQVERINAIASNLQSRYRTAVEAETLANVADLKAQIEAAEAKLSKWWQRQRHELVTVL